MANKVEIIVVAKDMTGTVFADVERKAKASGEKAGKDAGEGIKQGIENSVKDATVGGSLTETFEKAGKDAGDGFARGIDGGLESARTSAIGRAKVVGQDIGKAVGEGLDVGLADGGDGDGKGLLSRLVGTAQAALSAGAEIGKNVVTGIGSAFAGLDGGAIKTGLIAALVAGAIAAAPLVLAALAGAIAGAGVLTTVIGGAVAAGFTSDEVQTAAAGLGQTLKQALEVDAAPFVQPLLNAIDTVKVRFLDLQPTLQSLFANSAELVEPLTRAILDSIQYITEGLDALVQSAGPELTQSLGNGLRDIGDAIGYMFEELGQTEGVAEGLAAGLGLIASTIVFLTDVMAQGAELFDYFGTVLESISNVVNADLPDKLNAVAEAINAILTGAEVSEGEGVEGQFIHIKDSADAAATAVKTLSETLQEQADQALGMVDPLVAYNKAVDDVATKQEKFNDAVAKYGPTSQEAQSAGALLEQAILRQADAAAKAQGAFAEWTPEMQAAAEVAGLTDDEIADLRATIESTTKSAEEFAKDWIATIEAKNVNEAQAAVEAFKAAIDAIPTSKTTYINVVTSGAGLAGLRTGGSVGAFGGAVGRAATGGVRGNMTLVGEEGPELVRLPFGSSVMPAGQTKRAFREQSQIDRNVNAQAEPGRPDATAEFISEIRRLGDRIERMQLVIDGRVLGAIQGRDSDLLYRTA